MFNLEFEIICIEMLCEQIGASMVTNSTMNGESELKIYMKARKGQKTILQIFHNIP